MKYLILMMSVGLSITSNAAQSITQTTFHSCICTTEEKYEKPAGWIYGAKLIGSNFYKNESGKIIKEEVVLATFQTDAGVISRFDCDVALSRFKELNICPRDGK